MDPHPVQMEVAVEHPTPACAQLDGVVPGVQQVSKKKLYHLGVLNAGIQLVHAPAPWEMRTILWSSSCSEAVTGYL